MENVSSKSTKKHTFFKIVFEDVPKRLRIPSAFEKHVPYKSPDIAILEGPSGSSWRVEVRRRADGIFFEDGFDKFSSDHSVSEGDFLVFKYHGDMKFKVQIFGVNACEREDTFHVRCTEDETTHEDIARPPSDSCS